MEREKKKKLGKKSIKIFSAQFSHPDSLDEAQSHRNSSDAPS